MVTSDQLAVKDKLSFYLAMHTVVKQSSMTTKLRIVFDASACSTSGRSLNDILLPGLSVYPHIMDQILKFRIHTIGMTADVFQMFRQIILLEDYRDLHRFLFRENEAADIWGDQLTFSRNRNIMSSCSRSWFFISTCIKSSPQLVLCR